MELKDKTAVVRLKPGVKFDPARFRTAIQRAGYETRNFELTVRAQVEGQGEAYQLRPAGVPQTFAVRAGPGADKLKPFLGKRALAKGKVAAESPVIELEITEVTPP